MIARAIKSLRPNAKWILRGNEYSGLEWLDTKQTKPTKAELEAKIKELEEQEKLQSKYDSCKNYIYQYYPQDKQASDQAD